MNSTGQSSHQHILPLNVYLRVGAVLFILTLVTVLVAQVHLGAFNLVVALGIAVIKASLVALYFMHLKYDNKFFAVVFLVAILFLGVFIIFTMFDTMRRGDIYPITTEPIHQKAIIYPPATSTPVSPSPSGEEKTQSK